MNSRRSKPRSFASGPEPMKVVRPEMQDAAADDGAGSSVFLCVAVTSRSKKGRQLSYFRSNAVGEEDAQAARALAALCLDHAPEHHRWHHHTVEGRRTFAFLAADDGRTYLAVAEPTPGSAEVVRFLERVRDACSAAPRRRLRDEAVSRVVRQFAHTLPAGPTSSSTAHHVLPGAGGSFSEPSSADEKDEETQDADAVLQPEESASRRPPRRRSWRHTWWRRHAMAVIGLDVVLCLVLFGVWLAVCRGFSCVQR